MDCSGLDLGCWEGELYVQYSRYLTGSFSFFYFYFYLFFFYTYSCLTSMCVQPYGYDRPDRSLMKTSIIQGVWPIWGCILREIVLTGLDIRFFLSKSDVGSVVNIPSV